MQPRFILSWIHRCFILHIIIFTYFVTQVVPALAIWSSLRLISVSFWHTIIFFKALPYFLTLQMFQGHLVFSLPQFWNHTLLQKPWFCWWRLLKVPWTTRRSNQSSLKEINPEHSLEGLMLKLKLQYFGYLMRSWSSNTLATWCEELTHSDTTELLNNNNLKINI